MIKVIGIGNILLCDDGIGVKVVEKIQDSLRNINENIEVIVGETDYQYCIEEIKDDDLVIIIDSTYFMKEPGTITVRTLDNCNEFLDKIYTGHDISLLKAIRLEKPNIKGFFIGIEIEVIEFSLELSERLKNNFDNICKEVLDNIYLILTSVRDS